MDSNTKGSWTAKYEDGYTTTTGESVTLTSYYEDQHGWLGLGDALEVWRSRGDFGVGSDTRELDNGKEQIVDVSQDERFSVLGAALIWRRLTFEHQSSSEVKGEA